MSYIKYIQNEDHFKEVINKAAAACGCDLVNHHHALADAEACAYIAMRLL